MHSLKIQSTANFNLINILCQCHWKSFFIHASINHGNILFYFILFYVILTARKPTILSVLTNSVLLYEVYDPFVVFNISFLLSYAVVAEIILIGTLLKNFLSCIFLNLHSLKFENYPLINRVSFRLKSH
jgi:predicted membrane metal-binding protein